MSEIPSYVPPTEIENNPSENNSLANFIDQLDRDPEVDRIVEIYKQPEKLTLPNPEHYSAELKKISTIAEKIKPLTSKINPISLLTIDNLLEVRKNFLANPTQNPTFTYEQSTNKLKTALGMDLETATSELLTARQELLQIHTPSRSVEQIARVTLGSIIRDHLAALELTTALSSADEAKTKNALGKIYGQKLSETTIKNAEKLFEFLKNQPHNSEKLSDGVVSAAITHQIDELTSFASDAAGVENLRRWRDANPNAAALYANATEIQSAFSWALEQYYQYYEAKFGQPFPEEKKYQVKVDSGTSDIDVRDKTPQGKMIAIPENRVVKLDELLKLIEHEIESHARQGLNGSSEKIGGLGGGALKVNDEVLAEGLALVGEDDLDKELFGREPKIAEGRILYIFTEKWVSEGQDFKDVFAAAKNKIIELYSAQGKDLEKLAAIIDQKAWITTYRAFRGHTDTSNQLAYASLKDRAYLEGYLLVKQLQAAGVAHLNELAMPQVKALRLLARFDVGEADQDFPRLDLAKKYYLEKVAPKLEVAESSENENYQS